MMDMPITVEVVDNQVTENNINQVYDYFNYIDETFSPFRDDSCVTKLNKEILTAEKYSPDLKKILILCEQTKKETEGYFDIFHNGKIDPSGLVKDWAVYQAGKLLKNNGYRNFYIDAGGDVEISGHKSNGKKWQVRIRSPFNRMENVKVLNLSNCGIATSGIAICGQHIYNPRQPDLPINEIVSITIVGPNVYEADRFATSVFAMGKAGIGFIERLPGLEGYVIDNNGIATLTSNFEKYI